MTEGLARNAAHGKHAAYLVVESARSSQVTLCRSAQLAVLAVAATAAANPTTLPVTAIPDNPTPRTTRRGQAYADAPLLVQHAVGWDCAKPLAEETSYKVSQVITTDSMFRHANPSYG
jgi:hypothetical protein